jgi:hypothetical protein
MDLCCNWVEFSIELGFNSPHKLLYFEFCDLFWETRLYSCKFFFSKKNENLICITFVDIYHVLKIEN